jgi:hypothetical protein
VNHPDAKKRTTRIAVLALMWAAVLGISGWTISRWYRVEPPPQPAPNADYRTHVVVEHGCLLPCHIEIGDYMLRMWVEKDGVKLLQLDEPFKINRSDGISRLRKVPSVRAVGPTGQPFKVEQYLWRSFPAAVEYDVTWKADETDLKLQVAHRFQAELGVPGSLVIGEGREFKWILEPYDREEFFKSIEGQD